MMKRYRSDYNPILDYWEMILDEEVIVSKKVEATMRKLADDLEKEIDEDYPYEYDSNRANHAIEFIENFVRHSKGKMGGKRFILEKWQKAIVGALFGFVHKETRLRKYRELILIIARKNGKSALGSAIALYTQFADGEAGPEIYSAATKRDQAKIVWEEAKNMIRKSMALSKRSRTKVSEIVTDFNNGVFRPLASDSNTLDGLNVHACVIDELHAIEEINLYDVIVDGMSAREQPISIITTTAGTVREGIFDIKYDEVTRIINGYGDPEGYKDETVLPFVYELDSKKEWLDETMWEKANPGLGTIKNLETLENKVHKAKHDPLRVKNLLTKDFNIRETSTEAWLSFEALNNEERYDLKKLKPDYAIGGADLSETTDLTAACVLFQVPNDDKIYYKHMYWLPEDLLEQRVQADKIPYDIWRDLGYLRTTPGNKVNKKYVTEWFIELREEYDIYIPFVGYDSWSAEYWVDEMKDYFGQNSMHAVIQGKKTLSSPMKSLGADLESGTIVYDNNPITKWCLTNTHIDIDRNGNIQPAKGKASRRRIDGLAAMLNAYVIYQNNYQDYVNMI